MLYGAERAISGSAAASSRIDAIAAILREAAADPQIARDAPYSTPVRRLDEVAAAKSPVIREVLA